mgnify:CR=1 FL=1
MPNIQVLPQQVADKIAAGEVAERPSAVVKELVENAIDAGATRIAVEIKSGGVEYIRVTDNGCGIPADEVETAFLRHATSKLREIEDLEQLGTMGFRGEALASICAVATVEVITKTKTAQEGAYLKMVHGKAQPCEEMACTDGTTMIVQRLFENVPARMKFLKKDATEAGYVSDLLGRIAFSRPDIAFQYICDGKEVFSTLGDGQLKNVVLKIYGLEYAKNLIETDYSEDGLRVTGVMGTPDLARGNRTRQTIFVNGRYIKNHVIAKVVEDAYRNAMMVGKFPFFILNIQMEPHFVDVNVHPAKTEVKFANEKRLYDFLYHAAKNALYSRQHVPYPLRETERKEEKDSKKTAMPQKEFSLENISRPVAKKREEKPNAELISDYLEYTAPREKKPTLALHAPVEKQEWNRALEILDEQMPHSSALPVKKSEEEAVLPQADEKNAAFEQATQEIQPAVQEELAVEIQRTASKVPCRVVGQIFDTYVIMQQGDKMLLIDQHAAHERLRFEHLREDYRQNRRFGQVLLTPVVVSLEASELATVQEHKDTLEKLGFEIEEFGMNSVIVRQAPVMIEEAEIKDLLTGILDTLQEGRKITLIEKEEKMLDMISCKYAIKANKKLSAEEMSDLSDKLNELEAKGINTCPHGRPIKLAFTKTELEKMFKRIV